MTYTSKALWYRFRHIVWKQWRKLLCLVITLGKHRWTYGGYYRYYGTPEQYFPTYCEYCEIEKYPIRCRKDNN